MRYRPIATTVVHARGACCCQTAAGAADSQSSGTINAANTHVRSLKRPRCRNDDANERERHDNESDGGDRQRVCQRRHERYLLEQRERARNEANRDQQLRTRCGAQSSHHARDARSWSRTRKPSRMRVEKQPDRAERKPESGCESGPRVPDEDDHQRPQPDDPCRSRPRETQPCCAHGKHEERAHGGNLRAGEQHVERRRDHADKGRDLARREDVRSAARCAARANMRVRPQSPRTPSRAIPRC